MVYNRHNFLFGEIHVILELIVEPLREILQRVTHIESLTHITDSTSLQSRASNRYESLERYRVAYNRENGHPTNPDAEAEMD